MDKILVVEDDDTLREMYQHILTEEGFSVDVAKDGNEALIKIKEFTPNLILLDLIMPEKTGFVVLDTIKADEATKHIKVVVLTNIFADKQDLIQKGAQKVVLKTDLYPDQLVQMIRDILAGK